MYFDVNSLTDFYFTLKFSFHFFLSYSSYLANKFINKQDYPSKLSLRLALQSNGLQMNKTS